MADYVGVLADLRARRTTLDAERAELESAIVALEKLVRRTGEPLETPVAVQPHPPREVGPRAFAGMTMPAAIEKYLRTVQQPQTIRQIQDALLGGGVRAGSNLRGHVYNTLHRLSQGGGQFRRAPENRWGLREWEGPAAESQKPTQGITTN